MSIVLGKRKRPATKTETLEKSGPLDDQSVYHEALRRHFEAAFEPVKSSNTEHKASLLNGIGPHSKSPEDESGETDTESNWSGLSDEGAVQVVSYDRTTLSQSVKEADKAQRKQFMSSKPPKSIDEPSKARSSARASGSTDVKNASSLTAEDLALQRLLSESHLLSGSTTSTLLPTLKARQTAQDLRLQTLGAKKSINSIGSGNIPMAVRKGMENKKRSKERERRKDAKEAGIVLERETKSSNKKRRKRAGDVAAPAVGRWKGGTLVLGKRDVAEIEGQRLASDFGRKGKRSKAGKRR